jgi:hypothetical protein
MNSMADAAGTATLTLPAGLVPGVFVVRVGVWPCGSQWSRRPYKKRT